MLSAFLLLATTGLTSNLVPYATTKVPDLAPRGLIHHEVLRIAKDVGDNNYKIVVDAWSSSVTPKSLDEVRFWWVKTDSHDERRPWSSRIQKYVQLDFQENAPDDWTVRLLGDRKQFEFDVEIDDEGHAHAYAGVTNSYGERVPHCRATTARFEARRFLGIPVGLKRLKVTCFDDQGTRHNGIVPYRRV